MANLGAINLLNLIYLIIIFQQNNVSGMLILHVSDHRNDFRTRRWWVSWLAEMTWNNPWEILALHFLCLKQVLPEMTQTEYFIWWITAKAFHLLAVWQNKLYASWFYDLTRRTQTFHTCAYQIHRGILAFWLLATPNLQDGSVVVCVCVCLWERESDTLTRWIS